MNWIFHPTREPKRRAANTHEDSDPEHKQDYITLVLVALLISVVITGLITPRLATSPFF